MKTEPDARPDTGRADRPRTLTISRGAAWLLVGTSVWTIYIWATRIYTIAKQEQTMSFKAVHGVLGGISIVLALAVGRVGVSALRRRH